METRAGWRNERMPPSTIACKRKVAEKVVNLVPQMAGFRVRIRRIDKCDGKPLLPEL